MGISLNEKGNYRLDGRAVWLFVFQRIFAWILISPLFLFVYFSATGMVWQIQAETGLSFDVLSTGLIILLVFLVLANVFFGYLFYLSYRYQLGPNAYKAERGVIFKRYISIPYGKIQNVEIYRGVLARLLGLSDLQIQTAGYGAAGSNGVGSEGRLPGLDKVVAEKIRDELVMRMNKV